MNLILQICGITTLAKISQDLSSNYKVGLNIVFSLENRSGKAEIQDKPYPSFTEDPAILT